MKNTFLRLAEDFLWMMYPTICSACGNPLYTGETTVCSPCRLYLPRTGFHLVDSNPVIRHFWGKVNVRKATAYYYFSKGQRVQRMIHQLKYKGRKDVGIWVGKMMGNDLLGTDFGKADLIIPVPLHPSRMKQRGYNQCDCIAEGLSFSMKKEFSPLALQRTEATKTQTRKHRYERFSNVDNKFSVVNEEEVTGKTILLIDDVITTGSTLASCAEAVLKVPGTKVLIAAIACA